MRSLIIFFSLALTLGACRPESADTSAAESPPEEVPRALPMNELKLEDMSAFKVEGSNWKIAESVYADYQTEHALEVNAGKGVLVNQPSEGDQAHLFFDMEHGDLELDIDFLMPKGSNSGIYFQGRYEIQLMDSWGKEDVSFADAGGIYQRWDESRAEGQKGFEGFAPRVNASKAPGLWQNLKVFFRAPRFDAGGNKTANARFERVVHNGVLIHQDVELTGPTRAAFFEDEAATGPLMIQGDHGPVALRNIKYKSYGLDSLRLTNIRYQLYDYPQGDVIPRFDSLKLLKEGTAATLDVSKVSTQEDHFGLVFTGDLEVPVSGDYLFETLIDDGGELFIDGKLVVHNEGDPGMGTERGLVNLSAGQHEFKISFYEEVWLASLTVYYEGPGISKKTLASEDIIRKYEKADKPKPLLVRAEQRPEMVRGFVQYGDKKRTHAISVGHPSGLHYSYDLKEGALLKFWRGAFGDATQMWHNRGQEQLLSPINAAVEAVAGISVARLANADTEWPDLESQAFKFKGYELDEAGRPVFKYQMKDVEITDAIRPSADGQELIRSIKVSGTGPAKNVYSRIAQGDQIKKLPNGWYSVGGQYYLRLLNDQIKPVIRQKGLASELLLPLENNSEIQYALLW